MPRSIRFFLHNRWNRSGTTLTASGEFDTDHEATQTKTMALCETWRSTSPTDSYISADFGTIYKIGAVCLVGCNLSNGGQYRIRIGNTSNFSVNLYDSDWSNRRRYYSDSEIALAKTSEYFTVGLPTVSVVKRLQKQIIVVQLPSEVTARYVRIDFTDSPALSSYTEIAYVYAGKVLEPSNDLLYGWKKQRDDFVRDGQAACGQYWSSSVYQKTLITLTMAPQPESDLLSYWYLIESLVAINDEFIVSLIDTSPSREYVTTIFGQLAQVSNNTNIAFNTWGLSSWAVSEIAD